MQSLSCDLNQNQASCQVGLQGMCHGILVQSDDNKQNKCCHTRKKNSSSFIELLKGWLIKVGWFSTRVDVASMMGTLSKAWNGNQTSRSRGTACIIFKQKITRTLTCQKCLTLSCTALFPLIFLSHINADMYVNSILLVSSNYTQDCDEFSAAHASLIDYTHKIHLHGQIMVLNIIFRIMFSNMHVWLNFLVFLHFALQ